MLPLTLRLARIRAFFFQADDGIRGGRVTGVQTCALPIWSSSSTRRSLPGGSAAVSAARWPRVMQYTCSKRERRSEERRVGKEGRCKWDPKHLKKNQK